jgi:hypothetical protein
MRFFVRALIVGVVVFSGCSKGESTVTESQHLVVCDAFGGNEGSGTPANQGLVGEIYSFPNTLITESPTSTWPSISVFDLKSQGTKLDASLYLSNLDLPPTWFERGLQTTSGDFVRAPGGAILTQYFLLRLTGKLNLPDGGTPGLYQFALLSDDGSVLRLDAGSGLDYNVDNDGVHQVRFACGGSAVALEAGVQIPFDLHYFQGPPNMVALTLLYRRIGNIGDSSPTLTDAACGLGEDSYFFDVSSTATVAKDTWKAETSGVLSRWEVVPPTAFSLPEGTPTNPCLN